MTSSRTCLRLETIPVAKALEGHEVNTIRQQYEVIYKHNIADSNPKLSSLI